MATIQIIPAKSISYGGVRPLDKVYYIPIHNTGNKNDTALSNGNYFAKTNTRQAGAHYFVDQKGNIVQSIELNRVAYAVGGAKYADCAKTGGGELYGVCTNANSVSIELCDIVDRDPSEEMIQAIRDLIDMIQFKCPNAKTLVTHHQVTGKHCPVRFMDKDKREELFAKILNKPVQKVEQNNVTPTEEKRIVYRVRLSATDAPSQIGAFYNLDSAKKVADEHPGYSVFDSEGNLLYTSQSSNPSTQEVKTEEKKEQATPAPKPVGNSVIQKAQEESNKFVGQNIATDGFRGKETTSQAVKVLQTALNKDYKAKLDVDGSFGPKTKKALGSKYIQKGNKRYLVSAAEILLGLLGKDPNGYEYPGHFGNGLQKAAGKAKITAKDFISYLN